MVLYTYFHVFSLVCLVTNAVNGYILRLPCLTYANFSIVRPDHALSVDVLETYNDLSEDECENKCEMHPSCKSINTRNSTGENCQLIGKSTEDQFDNMKLSGISGWKYKTTDHKTRNASSFQTNALNINYYRYIAFVLRNKYRTGSVYIF